MRALTKGGTLTIIVVHVSGAGQFPRSNRSGVVCGSMMDSCVRLRPTHRNHVWSYDFVADRTHNGRSVKMLTVIDEYSRECLAIVTERNLKSDDVLDCLDRDVYPSRGTGVHSL